MPDPGGDCPGLMFLDRLVVGGTHLGGIGGGLALADVGLDDGPEFPLADTDLAPPRRLYCPSAHQPCDVCS